MSTTYNSLYGSYIPAYPVYITSYGVVITKYGVVTEPEISTFYYLEIETGFYLLQESSGKIVL